MGYTLRASNEYGEIISLTGRRDMAVTNTEGLHPPGADINMDPLALSDGAVFNSSRVGTRNIVITIYFLQNPEDCRHELYKIFKPKKAVRIYYTNNTRNVYIDGRVESCVVNPFSKMQNAQISILCPEPYFRNITEDITDFLAVTPALEFPVEFPEEGIPFSTIEAYAEKSVINSGEVETGVVIEFQARGAVINPAFYNTTTGEAFLLGFTFQAGDAVRISTIDGSKRATLTRDGVEINLLNYIVQGSSWFKLRIGDNIFSYTVATGTEYMEVRFVTTPLFEGV